MCRNTFIFVVALATVATTAFVAFGQCSRGGGGYPGGNAGGAVLVGGYGSSIQSGMPIYGGAPSFGGGGPVYGGQPVQPGVLLGGEFPAVGTFESAPLGSTQMPSFNGIESSPSESTQLGEIAGQLSTPSNELDQERGTFEVVVENPRNGSEIKIQTFTLRKPADALQGELQRHYWVAFEDAAKTGYREAKSAADIARVTSELRSIGARVTDISPVVARVINRNSAPLSDTSLSGLLQDEPLRKSQPIRIPPPSKLQALEGTWTASARTENGGPPVNIELKLDAGGWAQLTSPGGDGKLSTTQFKASIAENTLSLKNDFQSVEIGQIKEIGEHRLVVTTSGGQTTFLRK